MVKMCMLKLLDSGRVCSLGLAVPHTEFQSYGTPTVSQVVVWSTETLIGSPQALFLTTSCTFRDRLKSGMRTKIFCYEINRSMNSV